MALHATTHQLTAASKLPLILLSSPPLRQCSSLFQVGSAQVLHPSAIRLQLRDPVPAVSKKRSGGASVSYARQSEIKRRGFNAIIRWCAYHQDTEGHDSAHTCDASEDIADMDSSVLRWVQESISSFSCGQCLVVLTFLCDVLHRRKSDEAVRGSAEATPGALIREFCECISLLTVRSISSEQLEIQPFLILLSAAYGLHRITHDNALQLSSELLESLSSPPALWFALVHQVNLYCRAAEGALSGMVDSTAVEALLTTLLVFDPERSQRFLAAPDRYLTATVAKRLEALIMPALHAARQERKTVASAPASADILVDAELSPESGFSSGSNEYVAASNGAAPLSVASAVVGSRVRVSDFAQIIEHARLAPPACRANLMEYLLCVLRHPSTFTDEERRYLPSIFSAVRSRTLCRRSWVPDYILKCSATMELNVLAEVLCYTKRRSLYRERVCQMLRSRFQRGNGAAPVTESKLEPSIALSLLLNIGLQMPWTLCRPLLWWSLAATPEVLARMPTFPGEEGEPGFNLPTMERLPPRKVPLSHDLCALIHFLVQFPLCSSPHRRSGEAERESGAEMAHITKAVLCSIDWKGCTAKTLSESTRSKGNFTMLSTVAISTLGAYVDGRLTHQYISDDDAMEERAFLNALVLPILRDWNCPRVKRESLPVLVKTVALLTTEETKRRLVTHMIRLTGEGYFCDFFAFACFVAPLAIEWRVATPEHTAYIFRQRHLYIRGTERRAFQHANALKVHTTILLRTVRYVLAIGALDVGNAAVSAARRETVRTWFEQYLLHLTEAESSGKDGALPTDRAGAAAAAAAPPTRETSCAEKSAKETLPTEGAGDAPASDRGNENDTEDGDDALDDEQIAMDETQIDVDAAFTSSVTDADVEEVLSLMLQVGCRQSHRAMLHVARRMSERMSMLGVDEASPAWCTPALAASSDGNAKRSTQPHTWAVHAMNGDPISTTGDEHYFLVLASVPPLAAHFVCAVRVDSFAAPSVLRPAFLRALLASCDLGIFHHVTCAFLIALKRRRSKPTLVEDLQAGVIAFATLQHRLAVKHTEDSQMQSAAVSKSIATFLHHLTLAVSHFHEGQVRFFLTRHLGGDPDASASSERSPTPPHSTASLSTELQSALSQEDVVRDDGDDASEEKDDAESHAAVHAELEACLLRLIPYLQAVELKQLGLAHLQGLCVFFPRASRFMVQQLQPQLSDFSQRELLQLVAQYPAGASEVLALLSEREMYASVDLNDYVAIAKKLPMQISEAIVAAHLPSMTNAWVVRVLSALAARHEEMPLPLLRALLDRVSTAAEDFSESEKSLLMMVLQGYLCFRTECDSLEKRLTQRKSSGTESSVPSIDEMFWATTSTAPIVDEAEQHERREMLRVCCDRLLSLEHISTLEELRSFLISYPPSLHQMREQGVVAKVEQKLLPSILAATPPQWRELAALVQLLAVHHVLPPSTVAIILTSVFGEAQLTSLYELAVATSDSDAVSALAALLQVAAKCAEVTTAGDSSFPLLPITELVLRVFHSVQHWLAALKQLLMATTSCLSGTEETAARHVCGLLLKRSSDLKPSEFARLVQCISRLRAWDLLGVGSKRGLAGTAQGEILSFDRMLASCYERADAHSRCVLLKAIAMDTAVLRRFETIVFPPIQGDVPLLPSEDLELVLIAALQASDEALVEPVLDAIDTRMLPMLDQCRRSAIVRLLQCHAHFNIDDETVVTAALQALERQAATDLKLDVPQLLSLLQAVATLRVLQSPERLLVLCFQRLEKMASTLTPLQQYQVGRLILDLEMGYTSSVNALVLHILDSRDGARGHKQFQAMTEELCDVFEVELPSQLRASRLRKVKSEQRVKDFWSAQRRVKQEAMRHRCQC
ncbi:hypothetical protein LSCM1_00613 [Leishmania martiniquensis]|uniref:Uncharacterized protein n=1 Tax=Leishmania martiniquensis TaxID=1580590 RepID=A0A836FKT1_9TRYP|nr:hypothetical protein LSCM1_00613 [Leishmania martiniquensis]